MGSSENKGPDIKKGYFSVCWTYFIHDDVIGRGLGAAAPENNEINDVIWQETIVWCHLISGISIGFGKRNSTKKVHAASTNLSIELSWLHSNCIITLLAVDCKTRIVNVSEILVVNLVYNSIRNLCVKLFCLSICWV